jgi:mono/diheme cytochrome c family protein
MEPTYYPINDFGPVMKGMVIGGMGIFHVFLAQFAIGGGMLMAWLEYLGKRRPDVAPLTEAFLSSFFRTLVLVSFVLGALTGVGMWFTSIQVSPRTIGWMVDTFHWVWAIEWTFFALEIAAGYTYYRYRARIGHETRLALLVAYSVASWLSLFWINGILSWQLTPGGWADGGGMWAGFFNPTFWPSLLFRTVAAMAIAALVAALVIHARSDLDLERRTALLRIVGWFLAPMVLMPLLALWFLAAMPDDSRAWVLGGSAAMTMFVGVAAGASVLIGLYAVLGILARGLYNNGATAALLLALAFGATAGGEFVREGSRKPYTIRNTLYANSITPDEAVRMRLEGSVTRDPYPMRDPERYPTGQLRLGAKVFRFQCSVCHTVTGANGVVHLAGSWTPDQKRMNIAQLQRTKPFMPPFAGTAEEVEALVQFITWAEAGEPEAQTAAAARAATDDAALARIQSWLDEVGTRPSSPEGER